MAFTEGWEKVHSEKEWGAYPAEEIIRFVARNLYKYDNRKEIKVLDYGCGGGSHTWYLAREGFDTYAFDGSPSAIKLVNKRLEQENLKASVEVKDGCNIDYKDNFFDCVIDSFCVYANYMTDIEKMYSGIYRVLKKGGIFISTAFSFKTTGYGAGIEVEEGTYKDIKVGRFAYPDTVAHFWTEKEIYLLLKKIGFIDIAVDTITRTDGKNVIDELVVSMKK